jgi:hypothetical protein
LEILRDVQLGMQSMRRMSVVEKNNRRAERYAEHEEDEHDTRITYTHTPMPPPKHAFMNSPTHTHIFSSQHSYPTLLPHNTNTHTHQGL